MSAKNKNWGALSNYAIAFTVVCIGLFMSGCNEQARGFALPDGDIEKGKATFKKLACNECHSITGIAWKGGNDSLKIYLGGEVPAQKSYGELVTSVINPSHKIARGYEKKAFTEGGTSKMRNYNDIMTVQELVDLVSFLQSEYKVNVPKTQYYPYY